MGTTEQQYNCGSTELYKIVGLAMRWIILEKSIVSYLVDIK